MKYFLHRRLYNGRIFFLSNRICNRLGNDYANQLHNCNCNCNHQILMIIVVVIVIEYFFGKVIVIVIVIVQFEPRLHISDFTTQKKNDSHNCGVYIAKYLKSLILKNENLIIPNTANDLLRYRAEISAELKSK